MQGTNQQAIIEQAIDRLESMRDQQSGGRWLENLTAAVGPYIKEWDIAQCWIWTEWPDRETTFPSSTNQDIGIDAVAVRRSDGRHIAIQCKSRRLESGVPVAIQKSELDSFANASSNPFWAERWLVANGEAPFSPTGRASPLDGRRGSSRQTHQYPRRLAESKWRTKRRALPSLRTGHTRDGTPNQAVYAGRSRRHRSPRSAGPRPERQRRTADRPSPRQK